MFKQNVIANFLGKFWPSLLSIIAVPIYIQYLGVEAYGLVGFFVSLQALIAFLDMGLSTAANREIALRYEDPDAMEEALNIVRTLEVAYAAVATVLGLAFLLSSEWLSVHWMSAEGLSATTMMQAVVIFGITLALRWPVALYTGVLFGLERQVLFNILSGSIATLRVLGGIVLVVVVPDILAFLLWQLLSAVVELLLMRVVTWRSLVGGKRAAHGAFDLGVLKKIWAFSASITTNSIVGSVLKQTDKFLLSGLVSLTSLGYYSVAYSAYTGLTMIPSPVADAAFPRFAALLAQNRSEDLARMYHKSSQYVAFLAVPAAAVVAFFSRPILRLWTRSEEVAANAAPILTLLAIAFSLNAMMQVPLRMQLAHGIVWIALSFNAVSAVLLVPMMYALIIRFGLQGAGIGLLVFNLLYYLIVPHIMHRHILRAEKWSWILGDTFSFLAWGAGCFGAAYWLAAGMDSPLYLLTVIAAAGLMYAAGCLLLHPLLRNAARDLVLDNLWARNREGGQVARP